MKISITVPFIIVGILAFVNLHCDEPSPSIPDTTTTTRPTPGTANYALYVADTVAVRAILDSNGYTSLGVEGPITGVDTGRITRLTLIGYGTDLGPLKIPPDIGKLTALTELDLDHDSLFSIPPDIGKLTKLRVLELHNNCLTSLPHEIGNLVNLQTLYIFQNHITSLPPEICRLTKLTSLNMTNNLCTTLPDSIVTINPDGFVIAVAHNKLCNPLSISSWLDTHSYELTSWKSLQDCP
jgi:hypothetical protein